MVRAKKELPRAYDFENEVGNDVNNNFLTLHNDDVHTFDYVIETLMDVCEHDMVQAEQCAYQRCSRRDRRCIKKI